MFHSVSCMTVSNVQVLIYFVTQLLYSPPPAAGLHGADSFIELDYYLVPPSLSVIFVSRIVLAAGRC